jgi:DNA-directed RNA polymerase specialized sigma24 family protein
LDPIETPSVDDGEASWPERIRELGAICRGTASPEDSARAIAEMWVLLNLSLKKYVRGHSARLKRISPDEISDIAAEKALELLRRLDSKDWDPSGSSPAQLCGFLATIARNGLVDHHRVRRREVSASDGFDVPSSASQESAVDGARYARAILDCAENLSARARRAWFLRVFYEFGSSDIARDPVVATTSAGVDQMLARSREQMRSCVEGKGLPLGPLPPGTFVRLWDMTRRRWA